MATFDESIQYVLDNEGATGSGKNPTGYANDPHDRGGETNFGITATTAAGLGYDGTMKDMDLDTAKSLWQQGFWNPGLDDVQSQPLATAILDARANGPGNGNRILQQGLVAIGFPVSVDGGWGPETADATAQAVANGQSGDLIRAMMQATIDARTAFVAKNPDQQQWLKGWLYRANRMSTLADEADSPLPGGTTGLAVVGGVLAVLLFLFLRRSA